MIVSNYIGKVFRFCVIIWLFFWGGNLKMVYGQRPNVVLIIADDYRYDWMHHKGKAFMNTPWLDRLAREGWSFPNAFCGAGVCSPSRASILTGKPMHQASAPDITWQNNSFLQLQQMFPQLLHEQGYRTGYIGKFHLGNEEHEHKGFDLWASFPFVGSYFNQAIWVNGKRKQFNGFTDDVLSNMAADTLQHWARDKQPFCLVVGLKASHIPFTPPARMENAFQDQVFPEPETFNLDYSKTKPGLKHNLIDAKKWVGAIPQYGSFQNWVLQYTRLAATIDESLGKILSSLEKTPAAKNTIVIFTSDHGYSLGELSLCEKHYAYEQVMRVPLLVKFPNHHQPGKAPTDLITHTDIAATIYDYCLGHIPKDVAGKSWRLLQHRQKPGKPFREAVFFDFWHQSKQQLPSMQAVRTERYKYIQYEYKPYRELYDLKNDPLESHNLAGVDSLMAVEKNMKRQLDTWKESTGWASRSVRKINSLMMVDSVQWASALSNAGVDQLNKIFPKRMESSDGVFNIKTLKPNGTERKTFYIAIPVNNLSAFDPFIYVNISFPEDTTHYGLPLAGLFKNEEIYYSIYEKVHRKIPLTSAQEKQIRKNFGSSYNPPLPPGKTCILLKIYLTADTPENMDVSVTGALEHLRWL